MLNLKQQTQVLEPLIVSQLSSFNFYSVALVVDNPRACLRADTLAKYVSQVVFNTDRLTEYVYGVTHESMIKVLPLYMKEHVFYADPFKSIDDLGVGTLIQSAVEKIRIINPQVSIAMLGAHVSDPRW